MRQSHKPTTPVCRADVAEGAELGQGLASEVANALPERASPESSSPPRRTLLTPAQPWMSGFGRAFRSMDVQAPNSKDSHMQTDFHFAATQAIACISVSMARRPAPPIPLIAENPWCAGTL
jgi:hypothetical protein